MMKERLHNTRQIPHAVIQHGEVHSVQGGFTELTGFHEREVAGKSVEELEGLLGIDGRQPDGMAYLFTKDGLPVEVALSEEEVDSGGTLMYFAPQESPLLHFALANFNGTTNKNGVVAIFSYPEGILLQSNIRYAEAIRPLGCTAVPGKRAVWPSAMTSLFAEGVSLHESEVAVPDTNGKLTYWTVHIQVITGDRGRRYSIISLYDVSHDIHERECTKKRNHDMSLVLDNITDVINVLDQDGNYIFINKAGRQALMPYVPKIIPTLDSMTSRLAYEAFAINTPGGERLTFADTADQRVLRGEKVEQERIIGTSDFRTTYFECQGTPLHDEQGNITGGILIYKDTEREYQLEEYRALREHLDVTPIYYGVIAADDLKFTYVNQHTFQFLKEQRMDVHTELDILGKSLFDFYRSADAGKIRQEILDAIKSRVPYVHTHQALLNGEKKYTKTIFQPMGGEDGQMERVVLIGIDMTDEETAKREMETLLTAQEEIFVNTSHELKTPLSVIFSGAQMANLYLRGDSPEDHVADLLALNRTTIGNCYRLMKLINNILEISKIESEMHDLNLCDYNVVGVIDDIVDSVAEYTKSQDIRLLFDPAVEELILAVDVYKFDRILLNLISNAIKFSPEGTTILITLSTTEDEVQISVKDEGVGMKQKELGDIFKKFIQLNNNLNRPSEGTGLGLPLAKLLTEMHGGTLSVESALGKGSTFTIELPIQRMGTASGPCGSKFDQDKSEIVKYELSDIYF